VGCLLRAALQTTVSRSSGGYLPIQIPTPVYTPDARFLFWLVPSHLAGPDITFPNVRSNLNPNLYGWFADDMRLTEANQATLACRSFNIDSLVKGSVLMYRRWWCREFIYFEGLPNTLKRTTDLMLIMVCAGRLLLYRLCRRAKYPWAKSAVPPFLFPTESQVKWRVSTSTH
jgi:hypothetical protein